MTVIVMTQEMRSLGKDVALGLCGTLALTQVRCAPFERRARWLMKRLGTDRRLAEDEMRRGDVAYSANAHHGFDKPFGDPNEYGLVLNTAGAFVESCIETFKRLVCRPEFQLTDGVARPA